MTTLKQRAIGLKSSSHRIAGMKTSRLEAFSDGEAFGRVRGRHGRKGTVNAARKMRQLLSEYQPSLRRQCPWLPMIRSGSPEKRFSIRAVYVRLYRQTVQQQERERKHENKIVRRRACCERDHDCSSKPRSCSRSDRGISQRRSCTQCPGGSRSDAARRCFIVPLTVDAAKRQ